MDNNVWFIILESRWGLSPFCVNQGEVCPLLFSLNATDKPALEVKDDSEEAKWPPKIWKMPSHSEMCTQQEHFSVGVLPSRWWKNLHQAWSHSRRLVAAFFGFVVVLQRVELFLWEGNDDVIWYAATEGYWVAERAWQSFACQYKNLKFLSFIATHKKKW